MKDQTLDTAIAEANRFLAKARGYKAAIKDKQYAWSSSERAAVLRSSMDLTRALADLRQGR